MFGIGPLELVVLALVGLIVLGPERLPQVTKQAVQMLRTLREMATGARTQLRNELGPELADLDLSALRELRNLNPRTALTRALFAEEEHHGYSPNGAPGHTGSYVPPPPAPPAAPPPAAPLAQPAQSVPQAQPVPQAQSVPQTQPAAPAVRPLERGEAAPYDADAT